MTMQVLKRKKQAKGVKKNGKKTGKVHKPVVKESSRPSVFRCNLVVVVDEISKLKIRGDIKDCHMGAMLRTPFGALFNAMYEDKKISNHVGMIGQVGKKIISAYTKEYDAFLIGGEVVKFTADDVAVTFGLPKHGKKLASSQGNSE